MTKAAGGGLRGRHLGTLAKYTPAGDYVAPTIALSRGCPPWLTPPRLCNGARGKIDREVWLLGGFSGRESGTAMEFDVILLDWF